MKPRINVLTLGVDDLSRAVEFYRDGLGFPAQGIVGEEYGHGAVAFFDLAGGLKLALWERGNLAHDAGLPQGPPSSTEFSLGHNVNSREEVDADMERVLREVRNKLDTGLKNPGPVSKRSRPRDR